jgi:hypothetical protein
MSSNLVGCTREGRPACRRWINWLSQFSACGIIKGKEERMSPIKIFIASLIENTDSFQGKINPQAPSDKIEDQIIAMQQGLTSAS